jgi:hypothetical protein
VLVLELEPAVPGILGIPAKQGGDGDFSEAGQRTWYFVCSAVVVIRIARCGVNF